MPLSYWDEAFASAVFLINRLPTKKAAIGSKKHITESTLFFSGHVITDGVVAALQPPPEIQTLRIYGLLPSWIMYSFDHLTELEFFDVEIVSMLPPFWKL
ncbi:hypothetical protein LIER_42259 [Lithospermum erythrorhizon]|uniref:R13L1/DRL21-like LRR repeat region domain-containing protein n=1 Tax=Lithospermum erythrorhizon TaxID=34254 RepID=A0AAV3RQK2_LITER